MRQLLRLLGWPEPTKVFASAVIAVLGCVYAWFYLLPVVGPHAPRADDFQDYLFAAHQLATGGDPYLGFIRNHVPWDWSLSSGYLYPPLFAAALIPLTWIANDLAVRVWLLLMQATVFASLVLIYRAVGRPGREELVALAAVLVTFFPLANSAAAGTMNGILLLLLTAAWACWLKQRDSASAVLLGLASVVKLFPLAMVPYLAWRRHWRMLLVLSATLVAGIGLGFLVTSPAHNIYYFGDMLPHLAAGTGYRENQSLAGFTARLCNPTTADLGGGAGWCGRLLDWPLVIALLALLLYATSQATRSGLEFALAVSALPLISSVTWSFHLVLLLLPIALLIREVFSGAVSRRLGRLLVLGWLCFSVGPAIHYLLIVHPLPHIAVLAPFVTWLLGQSYFFGAVTVFASIWLALREERRAMSQPKTTMVAA